jgi:hypothetical protein
VARVPWRLLLCSLSVVGSILLAALAWIGHDAAETPTAVPERTHQLTTDQATCLRFGFITRRSDARQLGTVLGSYSTIDPDAAVQLRSEVKGLDEISAENPNADYRLVGSIAASADAGAAVLLIGGLQGYREAVAERAQAIAQTAGLCRTLAGFDTSTLTLAEAGAADG